MTDILVVGGTSGIAAAVIDHYISQTGNRLAVLGRTPTAHQGVVYEGHLDAEQLDSITSAFDELDSTFGSFDVAINCVGIWGYAHIADITNDDLTRMCAVNLTGTIATIREEATRMAAASTGSIVTVTSAIGASATNAGLGVYAATKAGVEAFNRSAAMELAPLGVRLNCIAPGPVETEMTRLPGETNVERERRLGALVASGRIAKAAEIAAGIAWLASNDVPYINGIELVAHGGGFGK
ncbi:SDR family oxidoreductase [Rhodococcus sp. G-MC3]|uniref:SDR family NAD(P)-dependent oxidoreductase n=1 Tax=Rhodococcus sp. G-MC3 TaxID=3046209 RepID=UPI0024BAD8BE|nr:SDR family oxidoreductase [Rhodococcus sp. G-MC3]MDJ0395837.1 SDR family oxidoreductase [Rhodococcus sp. G-MC3]